MTQISLGEYFSANILNGRFLHESSLYSALGRCDILAQIFQVWWDINYRFPEI